MSQGGSGRPLGKQDWFLEALMFSQQGGKLTQGVAPSPHTSSLGCLSIPEVCLGEYHSTHGASSWPSLLWPKPHKQDCAVAGMMGMYSASSTVSPNRLLDTSSKDSLPSIKPPFSKQFLEGLLLKYPAGSGRLPEWGLTPSQARCGGKGPQNIPAQSKGRPCTEAASPASHPGEPASQQVLLRLVPHTIT